MSERADTPPSDTPPSETPPSETSPFETPRCETQRSGTPPSGLTYEIAAARVEEIIRRLDSGEAGLRETLELVREGRAQIEFCAGELEAVSGGLAELRLDELVARLEGAQEG